MPDIIITTDRYTEDPEANQLLQFLNENADALSLQNAVFYYDYPSYANYDAISHKPDILILSQQHGIVAIAFAKERNLLTGGSESISEINNSLDQFSSLLFGRLLKSPGLKQSRNALKYEITPVLFGVDLQIQDNEQDLTCELVTSYEGLSTLLTELDTQAISDTDFSETRSVIEGAKALTRPQKRDIQDPEIHKYALALSEVENEIANFDSHQRQTALSLIQGPQRIRGLAGSGKTIILAMKAAHIHLTNPEVKILVTFYTKSLQVLIKNLISRFYRHYKDEDPNWDFIDVSHGWGGSKKRGVYSDTCKRHGRIPLSFSDAKKKSADPFDYACRDLVSQNIVSEHYDYVLVDEGQDFPSGFYELVFHLTKGPRDKKNIIWAYDDLQNILQVRIRTPAELFGADKDNNPRIDLERAYRHLPTGASNDIVLNKCYRNQREILVMAHALGLGLYGDQIVQLLQDEDHWRDVGYEIAENALVVGQTVRITRPEKNSPISLGAHAEGPIVQASAPANMDDEVAWICSGVREFIDGGLKPEDIIIIALDDRYARNYFKRLSSTLSAQGLQTNNIISDPYSEPPFSIEGMITLSTVYRAKGNEGAVVFACGIDAINGQTRSGRNKIFAAFTRSKGWLRVSGVGNRAQSFINEIDTAIGHCPELVFTMPDPQTIETIQRDLGERAVRAKKIREDYLKELRDLGLNEDEIANLLSQEASNERP